MILIVEDDEPLLRIYVKALENEGFEILGLNNVQTAVSWLEMVSQPEMIITDLKFQWGMSGIEFIKKLRNEMKFTGPVIAMSGEININGAGFGFDYVLYKPLRLVELINKVKEFLGEQNEKENETQYLSDIKILVLDDDKDILKIYEEILKEQGCKYVTASTGEIGLALVRNFNPDLMIVDVKLPGIDGDEFLKMVRSQGWKGKAIGVTGWNLNKEQIKNFDVVMQKPFNMDELIKNIDELIKCDEIENENEKV